MSTGTKVLVIVGVVGVLGVGVFLYLKMKKTPGGTAGTQTPTPGSSGSSLTTNPISGSTGSTIGQGPGTSIVTPGVTNEELKAGAGEVFEQTKQTIEQAIDIMFKDSPVPLPTDMTLKELQNLKDFCTLPEGKQLAHMLQPKIGNGLSGLSADINTRYGLSNVLRDRAKPGISASDYFAKLKAYRGC